MLRAHLARFLEKAEGKARADAESVLAVERRGAGNCSSTFCRSGAWPGDIGKKDGPRENLRSGFLCFRRRRAVKTTATAAFRLCSSISASTGCSAKMRSGRSKFSSTPVSTSARKHAGDQNAREAAAEDHEEQVVAGVDGGEDQDEDCAEIDDAVAREAVVDLVGDPSQARAACASAGTMVTPTHPASASAKRGGDGGEEDAPCLRDSGGEKREAQRDRKREHGDGEVAPAGAVDAAPPARDERSWMCRRSCR